MFGLEMIAPRFLVPSKRIKVLYEPSEFYSYLRTQILNAQSRVFLASLYLGKSEQELIDVLAEALKKNDKLQVHVLVDALRGTREAPKACSASLLAPLAKQFPSRVRLTMYQTPKLGKIMSAVLPKRIIEGVGLQHMKLYGFDNEIVLSGANLSSDYFTNRQDRYISIQDEQVTNWFFNVQTAVSDMSHRLQYAENEQGFTLTAQPRSARKVTKLRLAELLQPHQQQPAPPNRDSRVVEVYPVGQFTPLSLGNEHAAMQNILKEASSPEYSWLLTAGYFNIAPSLAQNIVSAGNGEIIVASAKANGFYKSKGISGRLPHFYSILTRRFLEQVERNRPEVGLDPSSRGPAAQMISPDSLAKSPDALAESPNQLAESPDSLAKSPDALAKSPDRLQSRNLAGDRSRRSPETSQTGSASLPDKPSAASFEPRAPPGAAQDSVPVSFSGPPHPPANTDRIPDGLGPSEASVSSPLSAARHGLPLGAAQLAVREWQRGTVNTPGGWSYHAKGIWLASRICPGQSIATAGRSEAPSARAAGNPFLTYIGSSNFTRRSSLHDIEVGAVLVTARDADRDPLGEQLAAECEHLRQHCGVPKTLQSINPKTTLMDGLLLYLFGDRL